MARHYQCISADGHVETPPDPWVKYVPDQWKDRAPRSDSEVADRHDGRRELPGPTNVRRGARPQVFFTAASSRRPEREWNPGNAAGSGMRAQATSRAARSS